MTTKPEISQAFGRRLTALREAAALRKAAGMRQADLARSAGITDAYLSQLEAGLKTPSLQVIHRLADALNCRVSELVDGVDEEVVA